MRECSFAPNWIHERSKKPHVLYNHKVVDIVSREEKWQRIGKETIFIIDAETNRK